MADDESDASRLLDEVGLAARRGRPVIAVLGGADHLGEEAKRRATAVVGPGVTGAARVTGATIVDGGTAAGVMSAVGEAVATGERDRAVVLGVAPTDLVSLPGEETAGRVSLEPNHSHFVLIPGSEWGVETEPLLRLADALAEDARVVAVLVGGGPITMVETLGAVRRHWSVLVADETGGVADLVAGRRRALRASAAPRRWRLPLFARFRSAARVREGQPADPELDEIACAVGTRLLSSDEAPKFARELSWELQDENVLKDAWRTFAGYDALAQRARTTFTRFQAIILLVGIGGTFLALLGDSIDLGRSEGVVHWTAVATPILVSLLIAVAVRIGFGKRWILLRGAAEAVKSEIFRYRTRTGIYGDDALAQEGMPLEEALATRLNALDEMLMHTDASSGPLTPYAGPLPPRMYGASAIDDGLSRLDADGYIAIRMGDQLSYFHPKVARLARELRVLQLLALTVGGVGALLAAAGLEAWIGLTTAIAAAAVAYLGYLQVEPTVVAYNQAAGRLESLRRLWRAQRPERHDFEWLVNEAEGVLATELSGWVQQMNQAVAEAAHGAEGPTEPRVGGTRR